MAVLDPESADILFLNFYHQAHTFVAGRAIIRQLMNRKWKGIDATGTPLPWNSESQGGGPCWANCDIQVYDDQPSLRSANREWPIPSIVIATRAFGTVVKQNEDISLRSIYKIYKETCQYCLKRIPFSEATRDHSYPKTLGGANEEHNIVLACKKCNNHKGHTYPYHNVLGEEVKPIARVRNGITIPGHLTIREEWKPYLYL